MLNSQSAKNAWVISSAAYGIIRVFLAQTYLRDYGLNIWWFAVIEISSSIIFGVASSRFIDNLVRREKRHRLRLGIAALAGYLAPDFYVLALSGGYPANLRAIVTAIVLVSAIISTATLTTKVKKARRSTNEQTQ